MITHLDRLTGRRRQCRQACRELAIRWEPAAPRNLLPKRERLNSRHLAEVWAEATGLDLHCAAKQVPCWIPQGKTAYDIARGVRRSAGFVRAALLTQAEAKALGVRRLPHLGKLLQTWSKYSRTGLTHYWGIEPWELRLVHASPGAWDKWAARVMRRANTILAAWETLPSYAALQEVVRAQMYARGGQMPRAHRAAIRVAAVTLELRFGQAPSSRLPPGAPDTEWPPLQAAVSMRAARRVLMEFRLWRQPASPNEPVAPPPPPPPTPEFFTEVFPGEGGTGSRFARRWTSV